MVSKAAWCPRLHGDQGCMVSKTTWGPRLVSRRPRVVSKASIVVSRCSRLISWVSKVGVQCWCPGVRGYVMMSWCLRTASKAALCPKLHGVQSYMVSKATWCPRVISWRPVTAWLGQQTASLPSSKASAMKFFQQ
jgi:hypothetical protein